MNTDCTGPKKSVFTICFKSVLIRANLWPSLLRKSVAYFGISRTGGFGLPCALGATAAPAALEPIDFM